MSTFCGIMDEMNYISIDRFTGDNLKSKAFFLSHCHSDHMVGLNSIDFHLLLQNDHSVFLYATEVSKTILENMFPHLTKWLRVLDFRGANYVDIPGNRIIAVTLIPAGHCPGSVMFLFESDKTLLYTGDCRIRVNELKKFKDLYDSVGNLKIIDNIYLDTTFFLPTYNYFPLREQSINKCCELINNWLEQNKENTVGIITPAKYGYEYLLTEVYRKCGQRIAVDNDKHEIYKHFPNMDDAITLDEKNIRIFNKKYISNNDKMLQIKLSAYRWSDCSEKIVEKDNFQTYICYSTHSSYTEIIDILKFLKPLKITPNVKQQKAEDNDKMMKLINEIYNEIQSNDSHCEENSNVFENKTDWITMDKKKVQSDESDSEMFKFLDSPENN